MVSIVSSKALYQTLYQSEHLFRVSTETPADWGIEPVAVEVVAAPPVPRVPPVRVAQIPTVVETPTVFETLIIADEPLIVEPVIVIEETIREETVVATIQTEASPVEEPVVLPPIADTRPPVRLAEPPKPALLKHKVLLLADEDLSPSDLLFLEKVLKAVNLDINGVDLLNVYGVRDVDFRQVLSGKVINHFITFGVPFSRINLDIMLDRYHPIRFDGITFLLVDSLPVIEANQTLKRKLWESLKRVFEL
jgi:DNA polymerase III psi subunit